MMKIGLFFITMLFSISFYAQTGYYIIVDNKEVFVPTSEDKSVKEAQKVSAPTAAPNPSKVSVSNSKSVSGVHIVKPKETLYSVARLYNLSVSDLCRLNGISKKSELKIDQSLKVVNLLKYTSNFNNASIHVVSKGDTLYSISKQYGVSVEQLKKRNGLSSNIISINQRLFTN